MARREVVKNMKPRQSHHIEIESASLSDIGRKRSNNEDAVLEMPEYGIFCVSDGMGGLEDGEFASDCVVQTIREKIEALGTGDTYIVRAMTQKIASVRYAVNEASADIKRQSEDTNSSGMGATVVAAILDSSAGNAVVLHAGDSRAYYFRDGRLTQLTKDHSIAEAVKVSDERKLPALFCNIITKAVGTEDTVDMDETLISLHANDIVLLCTDGLTKMLKDGDISQLLSKNNGTALPAIARLLVDSANEAGGRDNVSVLLLRIKECSTETGAESDSTIDPDTTETMPR
jgi:protein phosphatase